MDCSRWLRLDHPAASIGIAPLAAGVLSVTALPAVAQDQIDLGPMVVTASGHEQEVKDAPASISVIDRETLEKRQYSDITDALRSMQA